MGEHMAYDEQKLIEYFYALKAVDLYHKELFGNDKDFEVPQLFSQAIVKQVLKLQNYSGKGKIFDAEKSGRYYEIKATSSISGTTTLNFKHKAHVLVWIRFYFQHSKFELKQLDGFFDMSEMNEFYTKEGNENRRKNAKNLLKSSKRETVILNYVKWKDSVKYKIHSVIEDDKE